MCSVKIIEHIFYQISLNKLIIVTLKLILNYSSLNNVLLKQQISTADVTITYIASSLQVMVIY